MEKIRRISAWITIVVIIGLLIATIVCAVMGSQYFFGFLALTIFVPVTLWIFMWFTKLIHGKSEIIPENMEQGEDKE